MNIEKYFNENNSEAVWIYHKWWCYIKNFYAYNFPVEQFHRIWVLNGFNLHIIQHVWKYKNNYQDNISYLFRINYGFHYKKSNIRLEMSLFLNKLDIQYYMDSFHVVPKSLRLNFLPTLPNSITLRNRLAYWPWTFLKVSTKIIEDI